MKVEHVFWLESPLPPQTDRYTDMDLCLAGQFSAATPPRFSQSTTAVQIENWLG